MPVLSPRASTEGRARRVEVVRLKPPPRRRRGGEEQGEEEEGGAATSDESDDDRRRRPTTLSTTAAFLGSDAADATAAAATRFLDAAKLDVALMPLAASLDRIFGFLEGGMRQRKKKRKQNKATPILSLLLWLDFSLFIFFSF